MKRYNVELDIEEKTIIQNALINLKMAMMTENEYVDGLDELLERIQSMRPVKSDHYYCEAR